MTVADKKFDLIEAVNVELRGMSPATLRKVVKFCRTLNAEAVALRHEVTKAPTTPPPPGKVKPKRQRKTGTFREVRTIKNRSNGNTYRWAYDVTYQDGKRVKSKSVGRVK